MDEADFLAAEDPESRLRAVARRVLARDVLTVLDAASTLTCTDKEILILSAVDGLSPAEIGTRLGTSAGAPRSRLMRARRHLRDAL